uniref:Holin n=1 Tax=Streptomyces phage Scarif TaxID=3158858 RepID=A0AAU7GWR8_9CAUD
MPKNKFSILTTAMLNADKKKGESTEISELAAAAEKRGAKIGFAVGFAVTSTVGAVIAWRKFKDENKSEA